MLTNCNSLSHTHFLQKAKEFKKHVQVLNEMKKDLDHVFKRIKILKTKASSQFPHQYNSALVENSSTVDEHHS